MKVAHTEHDQPFLLELILIIDGRCRYITGWSLLLSKNMIIVIDMLYYGIVTHAKEIRSFYYSDNGSDKSNNTLDINISNILTRLGIEHPSGIPENQQGGETALSKA
ncbi:MAG: hypothetical protein ACTS73_00105 [Arsenophonus sp. NEOnobi-MAG3]